MAVLLTQASPFLFPAANLLERLTLLFAPRSASWVTSTDGCCTRAALISSRSFRFSCLQTEPRHCDPHIRPKGSRLTALHAWRPCASATPLRLDPLNVSPIDWARLRWLSRTRPFLWLLLDIPLHLLASRRRLPDVSLTRSYAPGVHRCIQNTDYFSARSQQSAEPGWRIAVGTTSRPSLGGCDDAPKPNISLSERAALSRHPLSHQACCTIVSASA